LVRQLPAKEWVIEVIRCLDSSSRVSVRSTILVFHMTINHTETLLHICIFWKHNTWNFVEHWNSSLLYLLSIMLISIWVMDLFSSILLAMHKGWNARKRNSELDREVLVNRMLRLAVGRGGDLLYHCGLW